MSLMTDDIEWYPLPEVVDDNLEASSSSSGSLSVTASRSSTAPSLSYLTPASSIGSFKPRSRPDTSNPLVTGTVQPYLREARKKQKNHVKKCENVASKASVSSITSRSRKKRQEALLTSSSTSFRTAKSVSAPLVKSSLVTSSGSSRCTDHDSSWSSSVSAAGQQGQADSGSTLPPQARAAGDHSRGMSERDNVSSSTSGGVQTVTEPQQGAPHSDKKAALDTSMASSVLTTTTPPTSPHYSPPPPLPASQPTHHTSHPLPASQPTHHTPHPLPASQPTHHTSHPFPTEPDQHHNKQGLPISPSSLNQLWSEFLASHLTTGAAEKLPLLVGRGRVRCGVAWQEVRDTGIQTTPSLTLSGPHPSRSHTPLTQPAPSESETPPQEWLPSPPTQPPRPTLQEALRTLRPDFVRRSEQRQRALQRHRELRCHVHCRAGAEPRQQLSRPVTRDEGKATRTPHFILIDVMRNRPKMSPLEMYRNSKKYWCRLPEVQQKAQEQRRQSEAATNRLRMKLYQQKVLERLRK